ncbi:MAG TPA: hypothetical protein VMV10_15640 [Pirellulales bacterium]|nr:hypothetical protein [Pirellulales bacterium]
MDRMQFVAALAESFVALVGALAWPAFAFAFLWFFRTQIISLLENLAAFDFMGLKLNLRERAEEAKAAAADLPQPELIGGEPPEVIDPYRWLQGLFLNLAASNPLEAVWFAWREVEKELRNTCVRFGTEIHQFNFPPIIVAHELLIKGILPESAFRLVQILDDTAREAHRRPWKPDPRMAVPVMEFAESAAKLIGVLRSLEPKPRAGA